LTTAKRELIHDHIDHRLESATGGDARPSRATLAEFKAIARYL
jgi:uncharacterized protein